MGRGRAKAKQTKVARRAEVLQPRHRPRRPPAGARLGATPRGSTGLLLTRTTTTRTTSTPTGRPGTAALTERLDDRATPQRSPPALRPLSTVARAGDVEPPTVDDARRRDALRRDGVDRRPAARRRRGRRRRPSPSTQAGTPRAASRSTASSARRRPAPRPCPTPRFSVRSRSARGTPPSRPTSSKTGGGVQVERSTTAWTPSGSTRARLAASPPPVTWREGVHVGAERPRRGRGSRRRRSGSGSSSSSPRVRPNSSTCRSSAQPARANDAADQRVAVGVQAAATPARRRRRRRAPGRGRAGRSASTTPVAAPATSYSSGSSSPGCSAVSPPTRAQPASSQPVGDAADDRRDPLGDDLAAARCSRS